MSRWAERVLCIGVGSLIAPAAGIVAGLVLHRRSIFPA